MKIIFKNIQIHSFMAFEDEVFDFSKNYGMTLIQGKNNDIPNEVNGSGKSTIFQSLTYVLFGQIQSGIKHQNIVNRHAKDKDMRLVLDFSVDDVDYRIARGLNKGKNSYLNLYKIDGDEVDITLSTIAETQDFIETQILHCDMSMFLRTILLTADNTYNFYTLKKADKKEFVEKLFDISIFGDMYNSIHKDLLALDKNIFSHQNQLIVLNKNAEMYESKKILFENEKNKQMSLLNESISTYQTMYDNESANDVNVNSAAVQKITDAMEKIEAAQQKNDVERQEILSQENKISLAMHKLKASIDQNMKLIDKHTVILNKLCNDCKPVLAKYYNVDTATEENAVATSKIDKLQHKLDELSKQKTANSAMKEKLTEKMKLAKQKIKDLTSQFNEHRAQLESINLKLHSFKQQLENQANKTNPYDELIASNQKQIKDENSQIDVLAQKHNYLKMAESIVSQDTLRKFIISDLIALLNNRIKTYLTKLGANYYVVFDSDMNYEFVAQNGTCEFGNFSGGERMRLMIATSFAFRDFMSIRNGLTSNILILDEYFDSAISSSCIENLLGIIKGYRDHMNQNVFVISHRPEVSLDNFDAILCVEKTNGISKVKYL